VSVSTPGESKSGGDFPAELLSLSPDSAINRLMIERDWSTSALGSPKRWPRTLRTAVSVCMNSRFPMLIWWGRELAMLYNDAYASVLGDKHPAALGQPGAQVWADVWPIVGDMLAGVLERGEATYNEDLLLVMYRHGFEEEAYFTFSYSPIVTPAGAVGGVFTAVTETTGQVLGARRLAVLQKLGEIPARTASVEQACATVLEVLAAHQADIPFGLVYLLVEDGAQARLAASYGLTDVASVPATLPAGTAWQWIWRAASCAQVVIATDPADPLPDSLRVGPGSIGDADVDTAVALPLTVAGQHQPVGVLVTGVSPHLRLDADYQAFLELVAGQVTAVVTDAQVYAAQRRRVEELAELDRMKTDFFTGVSHEFRTPLTLIMGPVGHLRNAQELDPARVRSELEVVQRNVLRLGKLVTSLLDFSRIQAGQLQPGYEPVDLAALTDELASVFRSAMQRAGLSFVVDCCPLPGPAFVDRDMWEKVVLNLLSNALKFTFSGRVTVTLRADGRSAVLRVADTGTGVPTGELPRLFERFHRVQGNRARSSEGSGIGLALSKELVELHGGTITAESAIDVGTTFTVTLPLGRAHLPAEQIVPARAAATVLPAAEPFVTEALRWLPAAACLPGSADRPMRAGPLGDRMRGRVLVADDNADMRDYLHRLLADQYLVVTTADGVAALQAARDDPPDLIVSDVMMPGLDGLQLVAALRVDPVTAAVPVLLLSARAGHEAAVEGLAAGADDYLIKPFAAQELLARVGAHVELGRIRRGTEQRFQAMANATPALIWVSDAAGRRVFHNHGWLEFTGRNLTDTVGDGWRADVHPDDLPGYLDIAAVDRRPYEIEYRLRRRDGRYRWMFEQVAPWGDDRDAGYVGGCLDIDERHQDRWRQGLLAAIGAALDAEIEPAQRTHRLTRLLVEHDLANLVTVLQVLETGELTRVSIASRDPHHEKIVAQLPTESPPARAVVVSGHSHLAAEMTADIVAEMFGDADQAEQRLLLGMVSGVHVPLAARGTVLGVLTVLRDQTAPRYTAEDQALPEEIGRRAGIALDNARLFAEEQASSRQLALLQAATAELCVAATPQQVVQAAMRHGSVLLDTPSVAVLELRETGTLDLLGITGFDAGVARDWATFPLDAPIPGSDAARERRPVWLETVADWRRHYPHLAEVTRALNLTALAVLPLLTAGRCLGTIAFGFTALRRFTSAERAAALALVEQCAQALQRAQLLAVESEARRAAERFSGMIGALSGATGLAAVAEVILAHVATLGAEHAIVMLRSSPGKLTVLATTGEIGAATGGLALDAPHPLAHAARTGEPVWLATRSAVAWGGHGFDLSTAPYPAEVAIPLIVDDSAIGALGMRFSEPPTFSPDERATILTLAAQCSQALDRARLYQVAHQIAQTLQRSLLPQTLPELARLALAARYLPGAQGTDAGGDWYDVLQLDATRVAIAVGDVVGQGTPAAAVMGQLRSALAGYLLEGHSPAAALEHLDRFAARVPGATASSAACVVLDHHTGELCWARAGHPAPLVLDTTGARYLDGAAGTLLAITGRAPFTEVRTQLAPGASVLLYTDGLIERRGEVIDDGLARLAAAAHDLPALSPDALADQLIHRVLDGAACTDDVALVVARLIPGPLQQRLPARPEQLSAIRRVTRAWAATAGLSGTLTDDLQLTLGEAAANAVEHAYSTEALGEFSYEIARTDTGAIEVGVQDFGAWRPEPAGNSHRGRGLNLIASLGANVQLSPSPTGTGIRFQLRPQVGISDQATRASPAEMGTAEIAPIPALLRITSADTDHELRLAIHGDLDLAGVSATRAELLAALTAARTIVVDLRPTGYLASAGIGLLIDAAEVARAAGSTLRILTDSRGLTRRILTLTELDQVLSVTEAH